MTYQWRRLPDAPLAGRDGAMALVTNFAAGGTAKPHIFGGWNPTDIENFVNDRTSDIWRADDVERGLWTQLRKTSQWSPRHTFGIAQEPSGAVHVFGSDGQEGRYVNDHWSTRGAESSWRLEQDQIPWGNRILGIPAYFGGRVLMMGGQSVPDRLGPIHSLVKHADIWGFSPANRAAGWTQLVANCPALPRGAVDRAVEHGGQLYLYGGGGYAENTHNRQVWRTVGGNIANWEQVTASAGWLGRVYSNALSWDGKLWHMFGFGGPSGGSHANMADVWHSVDGVTWTQLTGDGPPARHAATAFVWNNSIIVMCGSTTTRANDVWQLRNV